MSTPYAGNAANGQANASCTVATPVDSDAPTAALFANAFTSLADLVAFLRSKLGTEVDLMITGQVSLDGSKPVGPGAPLIQYTGSGSGALWIELLQLPDHLSAGPVRVYFNGGGLAVTRNLAWNASAGTWSRDYITSPGTFLAFYMNVTLLRYAQADGINQAALEAGPGVDLRPGDIVPGAVLAVPSGATAAKFTAGAFTVLPFTSWALVGTEPAGSAGYLKSPEGIIRLEGFVTPSSSPASSHFSDAIATLPAGARPLSLRTFVCATDVPGGFVRVGVSTAGVVRVLSGSAGEWPSGAQAIYLEAISFRATG